MSDGKQVRVLDPATGEVRAIAPAEAQQAFTQGRGQLLDGDELALTSDDGHTLIFPTAKASKLLQEGWRFSEHTDVLREKAKSQKIQAGVEGAASQLTLGLSDAGLKAAGVEGLAERRDTTAGQVGEGVGLAGAVLGPGIIGKLGGGAAKAALGAALTPMAAVTATGNAIESAASKALGEVLTNNAVRHAVASGLGRAAEGAAFGASGAISEASLGDQDVNAQHLLAAAGTGALVGGLFGAAGGGLRGMSETRAIKAQYRPRNPDGDKFGMWSVDEIKAGANLAGLELTDKAAAKWGPKIQQVLANASEKLGGYDAGDIMSLHTPKARAVLQDVNAHLDVAARSFKGVLDKVVENQSAASSAVFERLRPAALEKIPAGAAGASVSRAADALSSMRAGLQDITDNAFGALPGHVRPYVEMVDRAEDKILKAAGFENPARLRLQVQAQARGQVYEQLVSDREIPMKKWLAKLNPAERHAVEQAGAQANHDVLRNAIGALSSDAVPPTAVRVAFEEIERAKRLFAKPALFESEIGDAGARELADKYRKLYDDARLHLEDSSVYGAVGDMQREMNAAFGARADAYKRLKGAFKVTDDEFATSGVQSYVRNMDKVRGDDAVAALSDWRNAQKAYADAAEKFFPGSGIQDSTRALLRDFDKAHGELGEIVGVNGALKSLLSRRNQQFGFGGGFGVVGGAVFGGVPGAAAAAVGQAIFDPGRFAMQAANMSNALGTIDGWLGSKAATLTGALSTVKALPWTRTLTQSTVQMLDGSPAERLAAYDERVREIQALSDPTAYGTHAAQQLVGVQDALPNHAAAMSATGQRAIQILLSSMPAAHPASVQSGVMGALYGTPRPTERDLMKFAQVDRAVQDPMSVIERAAKGEIVQSHEVAVLEALYPHVVQSVRVKVTNHLGTASKPPRAALQRNLNLLMGLPPADPTRLRQWQSVHTLGAKVSAPPAPGQAASRPKTSRSRTAMSASESFETYPRLPR